MFLNTTEHSLCMTSKQENKEMSFGRMRPQSQKFKFQPKGTENQCKGALELLWTNTYCDIF